MTEIAQFRTTRLSGRPPSQAALALYKVLFGPDEGTAQLTVDEQDWARHQVAPWTLRHAGNPVGVGGFRIGFGGDGIQLTFHFLPEFWGQGLASEFVQAALDHANDTLRADRVFALVEPDNLASLRVLEKAGFTRFDSETSDILMRLTLQPQTKSPPSSDP